MPKGKSRVNFFLSETTPFSLKDRNRLKKYILSLFRLENKNPELINYVFTSDKRVLEINKQYLNHNFLTDIITFDLSAKNRPVVSEIYISIQRVRENAVVHNTTFKEEIHRVIFHGALHLCGYNDKTPRQSAQMRKKENFYIARYFR
jgi:rRNA maturation RNase YbeY